MQEEIRRGTQEAPKASDTKSREETDRVGTRKGEEPGNGVGSGGIEEQGAVR
jgi:hypothetical protein